MAQERRVLLANGQYITIVQTTGNSTGDVMSQSAVTAALNAKANVSHAHNASAITGGTFGTARIADGAITKAKLGSDVSLPSTSYETVIVSGLTSGGIAAIGAEVTIGGYSCKFGKTGVISVQIPYGQVYEVRAYSTEAWSVDYIATFTASTPSRSVSIMYTVLNGVFIEATNGMLYTSSNWDSGKTANSIVVLSDSTMFRIALTQPSSKMPEHGHDAPFETYMTAISGETAAKADYNGAGNTAKMLKVRPSTDYAAGYCNAFVFPDGKTKGYLPSLGQLNLAYQNKLEVAYALKKCGGTAMMDEYYLSSTFWGVNSSDVYSFWVLNWKNGNTYGGYNYLTYGPYVRPFAAYQ